VQVTCKSGVWFTHPFCHAIYVVTSRAVVPLKRDSNLFLQVVGDIPFTKLQPILYPLSVLVVHSESSVSVTVKVVGVVKVAIHVLFVSIVTCPVESQSPPQLVNEEPVL